MPGVSLLGPLLLPAQFTATMLAAAGVRKARILVWRGDRDRRVDHRGDGACHRRGVRDPLGRVPLRPGPAEPGRSRPSSRTSSAPAAATLGIRLVGAECGTCPARAGRTMDRAPGRSSEPTRSARPRTTATGRRVPPSP